jgi:adenosylcobinamide kinase/adenosylcobinamide-phosphate guanylyltransferase
MFKTHFKSGCMLVAGGARSGKSTFALNICNEMPGRHVFIATAQAFDDEMRDRINRHREKRGQGWDTLEESMEITARLGDIDDYDSVILVDCMTLWLNNLFMKYESDDEKIYQKIDNVIEALADVRGKVVVVSNEVGMGIVPENKLSRRYRDAAGYMNKRIGKIAKKVVIILVGLPLILKDD